MVARDSIQETTTDMFPHIPDDDRLLLIALVVALFFGLFWWWNRSAKRRMGVPEGHPVFGTYSGSSRMKGFPAAGGSSPVIVVYQPALELRYGSDKDRLEQEIRRVVLHELAHHLGMSHKRMKEIGL
jgi:predicted Zn-dependent protease with MMP-like domain